MLLTKKFEEFENFCFVHGQALRAHTEFGQRVAELREMIEDVEYKAMLYEMWVGLRESTDDEIRDAYEKHTNHIQTVPSRFDMFKAGWKIGYQEGTMKNIGHQESVTEHVRRFRDGIVRTFAEAEARLWKK